MNQFTGITSREKFITIISNDSYEFADCIVLLEGDGFSRIDSACNLYHAQMANCLVFSGGITDTNYGSYPFSMCKPLFVKNGIAEEDIILEDKSLNTRDQAVNVIELCVKNRWTSLILVATHYHQYRAFLTFLKVLEDLSLNRVIKIHNSPAITPSWDEPAPWGIRIDLLDIEFQKIEAYKAKGHISSYEAAINYLLWKQSSPRR